MEFCSIFQQYFENQMFSVCFLPVWSWLNSNLRQKLGLYIGVFLKYSMLGLEWEVKAETDTWKKTGDQASFLTWIGPELFYLPVWDYGQLPCWSYSSLNRTLLASDHANLLTWHSISWKGAYFRSFKGYTPIEDETRIKNIKLGPKDKVTLW